MSLFRKEYYGDTVVINSGVFAAASIPTIIFIADAEYEVEAVSYVATTASSSGTLQLEALSGTTAPGSGTSVLTGTISTATTANTVVNAGIVSHSILNAGDRLALVSGGTQTGLANAVVTIQLRRI